MGESIARLYCMDLMGEPNVRIKESNVRLYCTAPMRGSNGMVQPLSRQCTHHVRWPVVQKIPPKNLSATAKGRKLSK